jgi:hypothetical protein
MQTTIESARIETWDDISVFLDQIAAIPDTVEHEDRAAFRELVSRGAAFYTYDYGIDGVSIEITKYAQCLEHLFGPCHEGGIPLSFIGGDFYDKADIVLKPYWKRYQIEGMNGWSKWDDGKWFSKLYYEDMPEGSDVSHAMAHEIWKQAAVIAGKLANYLAENDISLIIPVNIPSNPGNMAAELALVIVSEMMGLYVINSNHDFYWEGGKPAAERSTDEAAGPRDHFFRNIGNKPFFNLFQRLYPWNGERWVQVNINSPQSRELVSRFGFAADRVFELGTSISDTFFDHFTDEDQQLIRRKMAYILSDGEPVVQTVGIHEHLEKLGDWMTSQHPIVCGARSGLTLDPSHEKTIYCLQPTRVIARKRIEKDFQLIGALMDYPEFRDEFESDPERQLVVHISGPVPIEHREDLETVLSAYTAVLDAVPQAVAERIFVAFSVGTEDHPALEPNGLTKMNIEEIYRLATIILFPSETEGRGLPIVESSAGGIAIACSRYYPEEVFAEVVGEHLPEEEQIRYILFPEDGFPEDFLHAIARVMLVPGSLHHLRAHNKNAVRLRYSMGMLQHKFDLFIETLGGAHL